jgi:hypothetical protein
MQKLAILVIAIQLSASVSIAESEIEVRTPKAKTMTETIVYDKAKWHQGGDYPEALPQENAFNHIGFFLGWMVEHNLINDDFKRDFSSELTSYREKKFSAPKLLQKLDGVIDSGMFNSEGNVFASFYYDDYYLKDYEEVFPGVDSLYEVQDSQENFSLICAKITKAYERWKSAKKG